MDSEGIKAGCSEDWKVYLNERDINVCQIVCYSKIPMGFNEIRRQTAIHQEILSRILKRLQFRGYIKKSNQNTTDAVAPVNKYPVLIQH